MASQINTVLDAEHIAKLAYIQRETQEDEIETIKQAITFYYQHLQEQKHDPVFLLKQSSFIGCADGDPNLSTSYKQELKKILNKKHGYR
jgi:hypothetical protein